MRNCVLTLYLTIVSGQMTHLVDCVVAGQMTHLVDCVGSVSWDNGSRPTISRRENPQLALISLERSRGPSCWPKPRMPAGQSPDSIAASLVGADPAPSSRPCSCATLLDLVQQSRPS